MGSNIIVVDVFVIHIDNSAAVTMKPPISERPLVPDGAKQIRWMKAVTPTGVASVAHQTAIHRPSAAVRQASGLREPCGPIASIASAIAGPSQTPTS